MSFSQGPQTFGFFEEDKTCIPGLGSRGSRIRGSPDLIQYDEKKETRGRRRPKTAGDSSQMRAALEQFSGKPSINEKDIGECHSTETLVSLEVPDARFEKKFSSYLIKNGTVVNGDGVQKADVLIRDGIIDEVGENLEVPEDTETINAEGKYILPGGIDVSVNLGIMEDFENGTKSALKGGTTLIMDLVVPEPGQSLLDAFNSHKETAESKSYCDYCLKVALPKWNDTVMEEMKSLISEGVTTFKAYMSESLRLNDEELISFLCNVKKIGGLAQIYTENGDMVNENKEILRTKNIKGPESHLLSRPEEVEEEAVKRAALLSQEIAVPIIISGVSGTLSSDIISDLKKSCQFIVGEPSVSALFVDGKGIKSTNLKYATGFINFPPLREDTHHMDKLWSDISNGSLEIVSSNHFNNDPDSENEYYPNIFRGVNGIEERLSLLWEKVHSGQLELENFVKISSSNAAKIFGLYPQKGKIAKGSDADLVIFNPDCKKVISQDSEGRLKSDINIFHGISVNGYPEIVFRGGNIVVIDFDVNPNPENGQFIKCLPFPSHLYSNAKAFEESRKMHPVKRPVNNAVSSQGSNSSPSPIKKKIDPVIPQKYNKLGIHQRPVSAHGIRNQQDSTFSLFNESDYYNDRPKSMIKVRAPPGGADSFRR